SDISLLSLSLNGAASDRNTNPLGDWETFRQAIAGRDRLQEDEHFVARSRLRDQTLRLAGPLVNLPGGPATLQLTGEHRTQRMPAYTNFDTTALFGSTFHSDDAKTPSKSETTSVYAELRSRVFDEEAPVWVLRGLELQLAVRHDKEDDDFISPFATPG